MDVFDHDLETVKTTGLGVLYFLEEVDGQVFVYDTVACCEKGEDMRNKIALVGVQFILPVADIRRKIYFFGGPEAGFRFFVELPDVVVLYREDDKAILIFPEYRFVLYRAIIYLIYDKGPGSK